MDKELNKTKNRINILTFLKLIAMFIIVNWHIGKSSGRIDWGARMCEFLFVASGFLVGFNYAKKDMPDSRDFSLKYVYGKLKKVWPLHILMLLGLIILNFVYYFANFNIKRIPIFIANVFLLQAWSPNVSDVAFSYNGVSWFLSALFFCYYVSPFLIKFIKKKKTSVITFIIVSSIRIMLELPVFGKNIFGFSMHTSPIIRCLEFFMGMLMIPCFIWCKDKLKKWEHSKLFIAIYTLIEIFLIVSMYFLMLKFNAVWLRGHYVLMFCLFIFLISFDFGIISKISSSKIINNLSGVQLELYLMQIFVSRLIYLIILFMNISLPFYLVFTIKIVCLLIFAYTYKYFIENKLANLMDKFINKLKNIIS